MKRKSSENLNKRTEKRLNKKQAAAYLEVSPRSIERYVSQGLLTPKYISGKHGMKSFFTKEALDNVRRQMDEPQLEKVGFSHIGNRKPKIEVLMKEYMESTNKAILQFIEAMKELLVTSTLHQQKDSIFLSLEEASRRTGLPIEEVRQAIKTKKLPALSREEFRIHCADLDEFCETIRPQKYGTKKINKKPTRKSR